MRRSPQPLSLKARAVHWLSQREHSEVELRRKLMHAERAAVRRVALTDARALVRDDDRVQPSDTERRTTSVEAGDDAAADAVVNAAAGAADGESIAGRIDAVIDWLREHDFLSDARFIESRVHARAPGHGLRRIRQELEQHGVSLPVDTAATLRGSEFEFADAMRRRRYGDDGPAAADDQARCARWLVQRGFSGDTVARVVRVMRQCPTASRAGVDDDVGHDADEGVS